MNIFCSSPSGRYSALGMDAKMSNVIPPTTATRVNRRDTPPINQSTNPISNSPNRCPAAYSPKRPDGLYCFSVRNRLHRVGTTSVETSRDMMMEAEMATAISEYNWPASSLMKMIGINTNTVVRVDASRAGHTSATPSSAACRRCLPAARCR